MRRIISVIILCSTVMGWASASEESTPEQINENCFYLGTIMGEAISEQRALGADVSVSAAFAAMHYVKKTTTPDSEGDPTVADAIPYLNVATAYADEIYKLTPRKPGTMGVYLYYVCQANFLMGRNAPSDQASLDKINALLQRCEAENSEHQGRVQCVGIAMGSLFDTFPLRE